MITEISESASHEALNETSKTAINNFLAGLNDGTPKSEVEKWYDRMMTVISEHNAREKERLYLKEQKEEGKERPELGLLSFEEWT